MLTENFKLLLGGSSPTDSTQVKTLAWWPCPGEGKVARATHYLVEKKENNTDIKENARD